MILPDDIEPFSVLESKHGKTVYFDVYGDHLCAYVVVPYLGWHGSAEACPDEVTYEGKKIPGHQEIIISTYEHVIGWDFAHCWHEDYTVDKAVDDSLESARAVFDYIDEHHLDRYLRLDTSWIGTVVSVEWGDGLYGPLYGLAINGPYSSESVHMTRNEMYRLIEMLAKALDKGEKNDDIQT